MSREVESLVNGRVIGEGKIKEGGKVIKISGVYRKAALMQFANRCDDDGGSIWVSVMRVAVWIECNDRHGRRVLRSLEEDGIVRNTGEVKVMENGVIMPVYEIVLSAVRKLPQARDALQKKTEAKRAKNERDVEARRVRRATVARQEEGANRATVAGSRATVARSRATVAANSSLRSLTEDLGSKEPKSESADGFALTPSAGDPPKAKQGKPMLPMSADAAAVELYDKFRASPAFMAIPEENRRRTHRFPSIAALTALLAKYDRDVIARAIGKYYKGQKKIRDGKDARGLDKMYATGDLEEMVREEAQTLNGNAAHLRDDGTFTVEQQIRMLSSSNWRPSWGDKNGPEYAEGRAALKAQARQ